MAPHQCHSRVTIHKFGEGTVPKRRLYPKKLDSTDLVESLSKLYRKYKKNKERFSHSNLLSVYSYRLDINDCLMRKEQNSTNIIFTQLLT